MPNVVAEFFMHSIEQEIKSSTIRRKISYISAIRRLSCNEDPPKHLEVKM
jgi:hypothetical protein